MIHMKKRRTIARHHCAVCIGHLSWQKMSGFMQSTSLLY